MDLNIIKVWIITYDSSRVLPGIGVATATSRSSLDTLYI